MAASADEVILQLQEILECAVCLGSFEEPRMLPCQHSFRTKCLRGLLGVGRKIRCPFCNKETAVPVGVQQLPVDFRANSQLDILSQYKRNKEPMSSGARSGFPQLMTSLPVGIPQLNDYFRLSKVNDYPNSSSLTTLELNWVFSVRIPQNAFEFMPLDEPCPNCDQIPTVSKTLSCGHRLCENCVQFLLPVGGDTLHCTLCSQQARVVTTPPPTDNDPVRSQLTFHTICGKNAVVHGNQLTARRKNPEFTCGDAILLTSRHLQPNELFEVCLDQTVPIWAGSIEIGVTAYCPTVAGLPSTISKLGSGTWWLSLCKVYHVVHNKWTAIKAYKYEKLKVGDRVGVQRRADGALHFYINGIDLGVAASDVPADVYGVVDLCYNAAQVTVTDTTTRDT